MLDSPRHEVGVGPLTVRGVVRTAIGMLRQGLLRVVLAGLVFFALPAVIVGAVEHYLAPASAVFPVLFPFAAASLMAAAVLEIFGPIAFSGFLDEAVARQYLKGEHNTVVDVVRELPWLRLLVADAVVTAVVGAGLIFFVLPGLILEGLLGFVGPVVVAERQGVIASLLRTAYLARYAPVPVMVLIVLPFAFEEVVHEIVFETLHHSGLGLQVGVEWVITIIVGGALGLLEVALATELMVRHPRPSPSPDVRALTAS